MGIGDFELPRSPVEVSAQERNALPQYGFGPDVGFDHLVESSPFLFRVHTPKDPSPFYDNTEPYFVGQAFADNVSSSAFRTSTLSPYRAPSKYTYADVAGHMDWTTRASSPYVSTSFSFAWAIWEATRRYHHGMKHAVEIAVIDAKALSGKAVTAVELLRQAAPQDRHKDHWKWYRYAHEAQDVLIWGYIPGTAVLASIPLTQILTKLPSYFLDADPSNLKDTPISRVGWDYEQKKHSYRVFCQEMSERFLRMPVDRRLRDTSAGAVRLAIAMLRPWFHRLATDDFTTATATACELALSMARWPGLWWVREHSDIKDMIRCLVHIVGEEAREARRTQALADATRMQDLVGGLETLARTFHHTRGGTRSSFSFPSVSSTASVADEEEAKADRASVFLVKSAMPAGEHKPAPAPVEIVILPTSAPEDGGARHVNKGKAKVDISAGPPEEDASTSKNAGVTSPTSPMAAAARVLLDSSVGNGESFLDFWTRTGSVLLTGFLVGTFLTMCVLSPHRREIANHFT